MLYIQVGRIYHTHDRGSSPVYEQVLTTTASDLLMSASTACGQVAFELNAYLDEEPVCDYRAEKLARLNLEYGWWGKYERNCKRQRDFRSRGTPGPAYFPNGRVSNGWPSHKESYMSWKNGRRYQAHTRIAGETDI